MYKRIGLGNNIYTLVDSDIAELINKHKWFYNCGYARRTLNDKKSSIKMHRFILNYFGTKSIDHINGNTLDNRKINLRICNNSDNSKNNHKLKINKTSKYKGVHKCGNKWKAQISNNGKKIYLGSYDLEENAFNAYKEASKKYHKKFGYYTNKKLNIVNFNDYEILPRPKTIMKTFTYEVYTASGKKYNSIKQAAEDLNVKENTIIKGCTKPQRVKKQNIWYGKKIEYYTEVKES